MWGMSPVELSILSTLALYAAEGRSALTQNEIYFYLHISLSFPLPLSFPRRALPKPCAKEGKRESSNANPDLDPPPANACQESISNDTDVIIARGKRHCWVSDLWRAGRVREDDKIKRNHRKPTEKEFADCLAGLQKNGQVFKYGDYYSLENRPGIAEENIKKARQSVGKIRKSKWPLRFLRAVPFARAIAVTGSVALQNARPTSDLDLLIIVQKGRIWTARIIALLILEISGRRREKSKEKICLNFFAAENASAPIQNVASANMLLRAIPLFGRKKYYEFLAQNRWTENFIPHLSRMPHSSATEMNGYKKILSAGFNTTLKGAGFIYPTAKASPENERASLVAKFFEYFLSGKSGDALEEFFKHWQYKRLTGKITTPEYLEHFVLTDEILMLHYPNPKNAKMMTKYNQIINQLI